MRLSKDDILKAEGPPTEEVEIPQWGGSVLVRGMTGRERDEFEARTMVRRGNEMVPDAGNIRARMVACCVIDEDTGQRMFTESDAQALGDKSAKAIIRIAEVAGRLSGIGEDDIEEMAEDFGPGGTADGDGAGSSSSSPATSARPSKGSSAK
jgi:hypothetical protein